MQLDEQKEQFVNAIETDLKKSVKHNKLSIEKIALSFNIINKNLIKELTELAIVRVARSITKENISIYDKYQKIVELYYKQANLSQRTSQSMLMQQYSTPAPIGYLGGIYISSNDSLNSVKRGGRFTKNHFSIPKTKTVSSDFSIYFEPSAGNGLLTIALPYAHCIVNEVDDIRLDNLRSQPYAMVTNQDAEIPFTDYYKKFDGIITNPPFDTTNEVLYDGFKIKTLDHLMALRALDTMKDTGKAFIIIGGHTEWDELGRIQAGKNRIFLNYLYSHYNVEDVINIDGHKLYSRQGTAFNTRLILINGRKPIVSGFAPRKNDILSEVVYDFNKLWERVFNIDTSYTDAVINDNRVFQYWKQYAIEYPNEVSHPNYYKFGEDKGLDEGVINELYVFNAKYIEAPLTKYKASTIDELNEIVLKDKEELERTRPQREQFVNKYIKDSDTKPYWQYTLKELIDEEISKADAFGYGVYPKWITDNVNIPVTDKRTNKVYDNYTLFKANKAGIIKWGKIAHYYIVYDALKDNKAVPNEVLADYPVLNKEYNKKEVWKMTLSEFSNEVYNNGYDFQCLGLDKKHIQQTVINYHATTDIQNKNLVKEVIDKAIEQYYIPIVYEAYFDKKNVPANVVSQSILSIKKDKENETTSSSKKLKLAKAKMLMLKLKFNSLGGYVQTEVLRVDKIYKHPVNSNDVKEFYKEKLLGKFVFNREKEINIKFFSKGLKKTIFGRKNKNNVVIKIDSIIATAIHYLEHLLEFAQFQSYGYKTKYNHKEFKAVRFWNFRAKIIIDNKLYNFIIPVIETSNSDYLQYSIEYAEIKKSLVLVLKAKSVTTASQSQEIS